jgi:hypothetical protein
MINSTASLNTPVFLPMGTGSFHLRYGVWGDNLQPLPKLLITTVFTASTMRQLTHGFRSRPLTQMAVKSHVPWFCTCNLRTAGADGREKPCTMILHPATYEQLGLVALHPRITTTFNKPYLRHPMSAGSGTARVFRESYSCRRVACNTSAVRKTITPRCGIKHINWKAEHTCTYKDLQIPSL